MNKAQYNGFMKRIFLLLLLSMSFISIGFEVMAQPTEEVDKSKTEDELPSLKDMALVRLGGQVYFLKDIEDLQVSFKALSCIHKNSYIEKFLMASPGPLVSESWAKASQVQALPDQLKAFILIEKLKLSSISSSYTRLDDRDLVKLSRDCARLKWAELSSDEKSLFISEIYLRQRFSSSKNLELSLDEFVKSLNIQHSHELLRIRPSRLSKKLLEKLSRGPVNHDQDQNAE
ncbi:MAG: hypothetical protein CME63_01725 [Halobacteriovoraceae bacterium]|nr:hypothetical protein [Halobacteriovoraceae bacterium]|tara:strand:+ start:11290 stop:11982 length:693 start_codon:yes stop_codon:yes gene_type:complete